MKVKDKIYKRLITNLTAFCGILILCSTNTAYAAPALQYDVTDAGALGVLEAPEEYQALNTWIEKATGTSAVSTQPSTEAVASAVLSIFLYIDKSYNKAINGAVNSKFN